MVAISLYRGNLHRVPPDVPRRWLMPTPRISLKDFRTLLHRRSKALSLLPSSSSAPPSAFPTTTAAVAAAADPNPNPNPYPSSLAASDKPEAAAQEDLRRVENPNSSSEPSKEAASASATAIAAAVAVKVEDASDYEVKPSLASLDEALAVVVKASENENLDEKEKGKENAALEDNNKLEAADEKEKRRREVEEKLQILNEKKHNLVQALKQILNAEEELKRRSNMQASRPPLPLQVDASNDSGSMTRHATPRTGSETNVAGDMEGVEGDDALNHNPQSRQLLRMSSTSPSAESALRRAPYFQHNVTSHSSRAAMVAGSPSRFAPSGNQGQPSNLPTLSVSGTNYIASSPSPAASGGTSGFRDARQPSPWN